ncbi:30S ribosomal protein S18 [Candidatus Woesebacteria bacterium]|nr:30S ribosomal protein S18 [Candidatus Woesebacteria bacterium]
MKCFYCKYTLSPDYKDIENIEKFLTPRKKILSREKSHICAKHQRELSKNIKYARYLALIPFTSYQGIK